MRKMKIPILAISIVDGVITLIEPDGSIGYYRQRGIDKLTAEEIEIAIRNGLLSREALDLPELPEHYQIEFEDEQIMGKAKPEFKLPRNLRRKKVKV